MKIQITKGNYEELNPKTECMRDASSPNCVAAQILSIIAPDERLFCSLSRRCLCELLVFRQSRPTWRPFSTYPVRCCSNRRMSCLSCQGVWPRSQSCRPHDVWGVKAKDPRTGVFDLRLNSAPLKYLSSVDSFWSPSLVLLPSSSSSSSSSFVL
jgi:hypothetical protein